RPPILRLPMASTSLLPPSCLTLSGSAGSTVGSGGFVGASSLALSLSSLSVLSASVLSVLSGVLAVGVSDGFELPESCAKLKGGEQNANNASDSSKERNLIGISCSRAGTYFLRAIIRLT